MQRCPPIAPPSAAHTAPTAGAAVVAIGMTRKAPRARRPATWLCSAGKISGVPVSREAPVATPTAKTTNRRTVRTSSAAGHLAAHLTSLASHREAQPLRPPGARALRQGHGPGGGRSAGINASSSHWPLEMSTTRRLTLPREEDRSATTRSGGRKSRTIRKAPMTHRPMKRPNSRSGCSTLARFAKKLTDVVSDVARHALPACTRRKATRASAAALPPAERRSLWAQKSVKTKTTSLPIPVMRKRERKEAMVVFEAGTST